jgi:hypothetical protein
VRERACVPDELSETENTVTIDEKKQGYRKHSDGKKSAFAPELTLSNASKIA